MRQSRFSNEQIISMIKEQEAGMPTSEVCRKHGISTASFYKCLASFFGATNFRYSLIRFPGLAVACLGSDAA